MHEQPDAVALPLSCLLATKDPGQTPFTFTAGVAEVITGWDQGSFAPYPWSSGSGVDFGSC